MAAPTPPAPQRSGPQRVKVVTQLVRDWESGNASFDRGSLIRAIASGDGPIVDNAAREWYYKWALFGPARREAPDSFSAYIGTCPIRQGDQSTGFEEDAAAIANALVDLPFTKESTAFSDTVKQIRGLMEYMCTKTSSRYDPSLMHQLLPLVQVAVDRQVAEGLSDAAPSLRLTFLVWFMLRQSVGAFPATTNLRSYRDYLTLTFEMLLQYHDPALGLHLAQVKSDYASAFILGSWLPSLFATTANDVRATLSLIDNLIVGVDEALPALLPIAFLMHHRATILAAPSKADVAVAIAGLRIDATDATAVFATAKYILARTPYSVRRCFREHLFSPIDAATLAAVPDRVARLQANVVLPVEADELMDAFTCASDDPTEPRPPHLNYVVLDCRAEKSFHHARLPTAVHVGNSIGFDPELLRQMVTRLESARGSHLSIMGTGRGMVEELNLLKIIALQFVQAGFPHVSFADGGFKACVPRIKAGRAEVVRTPAADTPAAAPSTAGDARKSGSRDNSVVPGAGGSAPSGSPTSSNPPASASLLSKPLVSEETKEKLQQAQAKAAANLQAAKSWGFGLVSKWTAKKTADAPTTTSGDAQPASSAGVTSPPTRLSTSGNAGTESPTPAPPPSSGAGGGAAPSFHIEDDDDDFGIITSVPSSTQASHTQLRVPEPEKEVEPSPQVEEHAVTVVSLQEVLARASSQQQATAAAVAPSEPRQVEPEPEKAAVAPLEVTPHSDQPSSVVEKAPKAPTAAAPTPAPTAAAVIALDDDDDDFGIITTTSAAPKPTTAVVAPLPAATQPASVAPATEHHPFDDIFQ